MVFAEPTIYVCPACKKSMRKTNYLSYTVRSGTGPASAPDLAKCPYCGAIFFLHNQWPKNEDRPYNDNIPANYRDVEQPNLDDLVKAEKMGLAKSKDEEIEIRTRLCNALCSRGQYEQALPLLQALADEGDADAQYDLGYCYYAGEGTAQDFDKAVALFSKLAKQGHAKAQRQLGNCFSAGEGVKKNNAKAVAWYGKAAEQGDAKAQCSLATCYYNGEGVAQDFDKAVAWYCKAAEQGDADAQYNLGIYFFNGVAVEEDYTKAAEWFGKAADQGYADAQEMLDEIKAILDDKRFVEELPKLEALANKGDAEAQYALAEYLDSAAGLVADNFAKAVAWYAKAAEQGLAKAQCKLGEKYFHGWAGLAEDKTKAAEWYGKAAGQGNADAQLEFGMCLYTGEGVEQNRDEAESWFAKAVAYYIKAAGQGDSHSQNMLAICYDSGTGVTQDKDKAMEWWRKAAANGNYGARKRLEMFDDSDGDENDNE